MSYENDFRTVMRAWGAEYGFAGSTGGWIHHASGRNVGQGWHTVFSANRNLVLNWLTVKLTAFDTFRQMVEETGPTYRPTILPTNAMYRFLADQYDQAQRRRNDPRRAYRGH